MDTDTAGTVTQCCPLKAVRTCAFLCSVRKTLTQKPSQHNSSFSSEAVFPRLGARAGVITVRTESPQSHSRPWPHLSPHSEPLFLYSQKDLKSFIRACHSLTKSFSSRPPSSQKKFKLLPRFPWVHSWLMPLHTLCHLPHPPPAHNIKPPSQFSAFDVPNPSQPPGLCRSSTLSPEICSPGSLLWHLLHLFLTSFS